MRVMLWQGEKNYAPHPLTFMYWPVLGTIFAGLRRGGANVTVGAGFSLRYHQTMQSLRCGDALIWVGKNGQLSQPWSRLRRAGVRTIYYNTEPTGIGTDGCDRTHEHVDELWDFSAHNLLRCSISPDRPDVLRLIPPGYIPGEALPSASQPAHSLTFYGGLQGGVTGEFESRKRCFLHLKSKLGSSLQQRYDVWNTSTFASLMNVSDIFLNLHKKCGKRHPVTFRVAVLLNQAKLVLSERAHCLDEQAWAALVRFVALDDVPTEFERMTSANVREVQTRIYREFRHRFAPEMLFNRARVYHDWGLEVDGLTTSEHDGGGAALYLLQPPSALFSNRNRLQCAVEYKQMLRSEQRPRRGPAPVWRLMANASDHLQNHLPSHVLRRLRMMNRTCVASQK
jgi:hypothetical protein